MYKFARLARFTEFSAFVEDENFSIRNGFAHGCGSPVQFLGREISRPKGFSEAVHEEYFCIGEDLSKCTEDRLWHCATRISDVAKMGERLLVQGGVWLREK